MSKFFVTNRSELFKRIKTVVEESPYEVCFECSDKLYALTTKKLCADNYNGRKEPNGFITITGSLIWQDGYAVDKSVLESIYTNFDGNIDLVRNTSLGNYAVTIYKNEALYVFGEATGFYNIFYYKSDGCWLISNSLYDMYLVLNDRLTVDKMSYIEYIVQNGILWGDTIFNEIKRLIGSNYIKLENGCLDIVDSKVFYPMFNGSVEDAVRQYSELMREYAKKMTKAYGAPTIAMTGGLDARMLLASFLSVGVKPDLYYGTGNSFITNTHDEDKEIDRIYAQKYGLKLHEVSWESPIPVDKYWEQYLSYYGLYYKTYASSDAVMKSVEENKTKSLVFGEGGEMLRNQEWIDARDSDSFTLDEYIDEFYLTKDIMDTIVDAAEFRSYIREKYKKICQYHNLDTQKISNEDIFILTLERRKTADSSTINWMNLIRYDNAQMTEYEGLLAARVRNGDTFGAKFMLQCYKQMYPDILDIPVFSHCRMRKIDRDKLVIYVPMTWKRKTKDMIKKYFPCITSFLSKIIRRNTGFPDEGDEIRYKNVVELNRLYDKREWFRIEKFADPRSIVSNTMTCYAIKEIFNK